MCVLDAFAPIVHISENCADGMVPNSVGTPIASIPSHFRSRVTPSLSNVEDRMHAIKNSHSNSSLILVQVCISTFIVGK